eukprot:PhF_6_TR39634/c0_g1_i6/m.58744
MRMHLKLSSQSISYACIQQKFQVYLPTARRCGLCTMLCERWQSVNSTCYMVLSRNVPVGRCLYDAHCFWTQMCHRGAEWTAHAMAVWKAFLCEFSVQHRHSIHMLVDAFLKQNCDLCFVPATLNMREQQ